MVSRRRRTRLGLAGGLVGGAGEALLGLVEGGLGGVRGLGGLAVVAVRGMHNIRASPQPWCGNPCERPQTC
jgi:hypothetical protein